MILQEILNQPYEFKLKKFDDGMAASFKNAQEKVTVSFIAYHIPETGWAYEVSFGVNGSTELTGKGDEFRTFSTIMAIVDAFLRKKTPSPGNWTPSGNPVLMFATANSSKRSGLYKKLMTKVASQYRFKIKTPDELPEKIQEWWKRLDLDGDTPIIASTL